jgi:hypothetical protein
MRSRERGEDIDTRFLTEWGADRDRREIRQSVAAAQQRVTERHRASKHSAAENQHAAERRVGERRAAELRAERHAAERRAAERRAVGYLADEHQRQQHLDPEAALRRSARLRMQQVEFEHLLGLRPANDYSQL